MTAESGEEGKCKHESTWFDRTVCPRDNGSYGMAYICNDCAKEVWPEQQPAAESMLTNMSVNKLDDKSESVKLCYHANPTYCNECFGDLERQLKDFQRDRGDYLERNMNLERQLKEANGKIDKESFERINNRADVARIKEWLNLSPRKPANVYFTEGPDRQIAYLFERLEQQVRELRQNLNAVSEPASKENSDVAVPGSVYFGKDKRT